MLSFLLLVLFLSLQTLPLHIEGAHAYFIQNADCTSQYSCVGEVRDISVICQNLKCICDPRLGVYDPIRYQCVGRADHACLGDYCTRNSACDYATQTCKCQPSYEISSDGRCVHKYNENCEENEDCKTGFTCYEGKCECKFPNHMYYHPENKTCYSIAHSWDKHYQEMRNNSKALSPSDINRKPTDRASVLFGCLEILLSLLGVAGLGVVALLLWKIEKTLKRTLATFKIHGYFLRSDFHNTKLDAETGEQPDATLIDVKI